MMFMVDLRPFAMAFKGKGLYPAVFLSPNDDWLSLDVYFISYIIHYPLST